ncbi:MAG: hypothetical protein ACE5JU_17410 [Candidatus Binatia bacterium]
MTSHDNWSTRLWMFYDVRKSVHPSPVPMEESYAVPIFRTLAALNPTIFFFSQIQLFDRLKAILGGLLSRSICRLI